MGNAETCAKPGPIVVELTTDGLVIACSWCTPPAKLLALNRIHRVSHTACASCVERMLEAL